jgi:hypothetical protein
MNRAVPQEALRVTTTWWVCPPQLRTMVEPGLIQRAACALPRASLSRRSLVSGVRPASDLLLELVGHCPDQEITAEGGWSERR